MSYFNWTKSKIIQLSVITFITTVWFLIFNLIAIAWLAVSANKKSNQLPDNFQIQAYMNEVSRIPVDTLYVHEVVRDFNTFSLGGSGFRYQPETEFTHTLFSSKHLNIVSGDNDLPRRTTLPEGSTKNDSIVSIYCFGGSTTFGLYVSDEHTWPALLMKNFTGGYPGKHVITRNYAVSAYTPTQETNLFINLLKLGHRPSLCIFLDGVNTGPAWDCSEFSRSISARFRMKDELQVSQVLNSLPLKKLVDHLLDRNPYSDAPDSLLQPALYTRGTYNSLLIERFIRNAEYRQLIADHYGIPIIQILQPNIAVTDKNYYLVKTMEKYPVFEQSRANYGAIYAGILQSGCGYVDLSGIINTYPYVPVMDGCHYSPNFNQRLADSIMPYINAEQLAAFRLEAAKATGLAYPD